PDGRSRGRAPVPVPRLWDRDGPPPLPRPGPRPATLRVLPRAVPDAPAPRGDGELHGRPRGGVARGAELGAAPHRPARSALSSSGSAGGRHSDKTSEPTTMRSSWTAWASSATDSARASVVPRVSAANVKPPSLAPSWPGIITPRAAITS